MKLHITLEIVLATLLVTACARVTAPEDPQIEIEDPWVRAVPAMNMQLEDDSSSDSTSHMGGDTSAAYMTLRNNGKAADRLIGVQSDAAEIVEMHTTQTTNDVSMMAKVENIEIPAQGKVTLEPGGTHLMLIRLRRELSAGEKVQLTLDFEISGQMQVEAEVRAP
jgi:copper(I)-binding protein